MIKFIDGNLFDSKANFIVHSCNCQSFVGNNITRQISENFSHVETEYMKYLRYCKKNHIELLGSAQYVPTEYWALYMVDTMKNNNVVDFDTNYQYIVNLFCQDASDERFHTDMRALKQGFIDIREKAQKIGATVAIPYKFGSGRSGTNWDDIYTIIKKIFEKSDVSVEIWR